MLEEGIDAHRPGSHEYKPGRRGCHSSSVPLPVHSTVENFITACSLAERMCALVALNGLFLRVTSTTFPAASSITPCVVQRQHNCLAAGPNGAHRAGNAVQLLLQPSAPGWDGPPSCRRCPRIVESRQALFAGLQVCRTARQGRQ